MEHKIIVKKKFIAIIRYFIFAFLFVPPEMIDIIPRYSNLDKAITIVSFLMGIIFVMFFIKNNRKIKDGMRFLLCLLLLMGWLLFVNIIMGDSMGMARNLITMIRVSGYCCLILNSFQQNEDDDMISGTFFYCMVVLIFNVFSQLHYGAKGIFYDRYLVGWQSIYVCGNANRFALFYIFSFCISICYLICKKKKNVFILPILLLLLYSSFISLSDMAKIISILMSIGLIISNSFIFSFIGKHRKLLLLFAGVGAFWMIGLAGWKNGFIISLVGKITDKRSFVIRGSLWNSTIDYVLKSPLVGYGTSAYRIAQNMHGEYQSAHNTYLQIMTFGGIPAFVLFLFITVIPFRISRIGTKIQYYISFCIFLYLLVYLFEQNPFYPGYYALLAVLVGEAIYHPSISYNNIEEKRENNCGNMH